MAKCPRCSEPVSQFAAGCAVCGADLAAPRQAAARRRQRRRRLPSLPGVSEDAVVFLVLLLLVLAVPVLGVLLSLLALTRALTSQRPALWALVALGVLLVAVPATRFGLLS